MKRSRWALGAVLAGLIGACGGAAFSVGDGGAGDGGGGGGSSAGGSGGSSGGASGSSGGSGGTSGSGGSASGGSGGSSGAASSGGRSSGGGSGSGGSSGGSSGGANSGGSSSGVVCTGACEGGVPPVSCPTALPASGASCTSAGLECEYGTNPVLGCNPLATCTKSAWVIQTPSASTNCSTTPGSSACPRSFAQVPVGAPCPDNALPCDYVEGRCECTVTGGGGGVDASALSSWQCPEPAGGCPLPRAPLGSRCTEPNLSCDYGACYIEGASAQACTNGIWTPALVACPL